MFHGSTICSFKGKAFTSQLSEWLLFMCKNFQAGITKILQNPTLIPQAKPSNSALPSLFEWSEGSHPKPLNIIQSAAAVTVSLLDFYSWPQKLSSPPESLVWLH